KAREAAAEILNVVGLGHRLTHLPSQVSGGQQQRIAIARALLNRPQVILADEPTGNLDGETADGILRLLRKLNEDGTAIIMVTHNRSIFERFPGRVFSCADEHCEELFEDNTFELDLTI
ncbi:MAG: ATP-binding cassette domain-containing protein, partial [Bacteroidales bacterium]|nr:ATP-binding cassette domain-containing protein [Bacteroidales bacterium]